MNGLGVMIGISSLLNSLTRALAPRPRGARPAIGEPDRAPRAAVDELLRRREPLQAEILARELLAEAEFRHGTSSLEVAAASELVVDTMLSGRCEPDVGAVHLPPSRLEQAQRLAERAIKLRERHLGPLHATLARPLRNLALVKAARWGAGAAVPHLRRALRLVDRGARGADAFVPDLLTDLSQAYRRSGRPVAARHALEAAIARVGRVAQRGPEFVLTANRLARLCLEDGDAGAARPLLESALLVAETSRMNDLLVAGTAYNLGLVLVGQAELEPAREMFEHTLEIEERTLGPDHPDVAATLIELGLCLEKAGDAPQARTRLLRALEVLEFACGPESEELVPVLAPLARVHAACGEPQRGKPLLVRLLELRQGRLGSKHPDLVVTINNLAFLAEASGNFVEARQWRERALVVGETAWGPDHPNLAPTLESLGALLWSGEDWVACRRVNERLLRIRRLELGADHPAVALKLQDLAALETRAGATTRAATLFGEALGILERTPHRQRAVVQKILLNLELLSGEEDDDEDEFGPLLQRARALDRRSLSGPPMAEA